MKESIKVLQEAIELQKKKSLDYQNPNSHIKQAHHYPRGIATILDMVHQKVTRMYSLTESGHAANFESIEDSAIDAINYLSFLVEYSRGKMDGQDPNRDAFNKPKVQNIEKEPNTAMPPEIEDTLKKYYEEYNIKMNQWKDIGVTQKYPIPFESTYRANNSPIAAISLSTIILTNNGSMND